MTDKLSIVLNEIKQGYEEFKKFEKSIANLENLLKEQAEKQPEIEERVYNCIKIEMKINVFGNEHIDYESFKDFILVTKKLNKELKITTFLAIMQAVHILIEGKERKFDVLKYNFTFFYNKEKCIISSGGYEYNMYFPNFFYFSTPENRDRAISILSNFFGVDLLKWWFE